MSLLSSPSSLGFLDFSCGLSLSCLFLFQLLYGLAKFGLSELRPLLVARARAFQKIVCVDWGMLLSEDCPARALGMIAFFALLHKLVDYDIPAPVDSKRFY